MILTVFEENLKHDFPEPNDVGPCGLKEERSHDDHNGKEKRRARDQHVVVEQWTWEKKRAASFFPFNHQLPPESLFAPPIRALSIPIAFLIFSRRPSFIQKQHRPCRLVYQLVVSSLSLLFIRSAHLL